MSKVAIQGNASGTGTFTIAAPNSNSNRTLNLPDEAGTVLSSVSSLAAANLTGSVPKAALPSGSVLQVVQGTFGPSDTTTASSTFIDTGLSASITPSSSNSKILVIVSQDMGKQTNDLNAIIQLVRGSTPLATILNAYTASSASLLYVNTGYSYLDSPATTSSTTYKTQVRSSNGLSSARFGAITATIILMEIAA